MKKKEKNITDSKTILQLEIIGLHELRSQAKIIIGIAKQLEIEINKFNKLQINLKA